MKNRNCLILIPARYASTRFPGKPLSIINGKTMIQIVFENLMDGNNNGPWNFTVAVVTDDDRIENHIKDFGGKVIRVDDEVSTGSERIFLGWQRYFAKDDFALIINVQGDEPLLKRSAIEKLADFHLKNKFDIATVVVPKTMEDAGFTDPNRVKVIYCEDSGNCIYFSRAQIPFPRDEKFDKWFLHVGIYSYLPHAIQKFNQTKKSYYETAEKLEQLRALECGLTIGAISSNDNFIGVDSPEDIKIVEGVLSGKK